MVGGVTGLIVLDWHVALQFIGSSALLVSLAARILSYDSPQVGWTETNNILVVLTYVHTQGMAVTSLHPSMILQDAYADLQNGYGLKWVFRGPIVLAQFMAEKLRATRSPSTTEVQAEIKAPGE